MGLPLRSVSGYRLLLHHADVGLHSYKSNLHRFFPEQWNHSSYRIGDN